MTTVAGLLILGSTTIIVVLVTIVLLHRPTKPSSQPPKPKALTFRVDDIPADQTDDVLYRNLKTIIEQDLILRAADVTPVHHSLALKDKHTLCATISVETSLSADDLCNRLRRAGTSHRYIYSYKFDAITPLHANPGGADVE